MNIFKKIISGGQTGVDRAALDWAKLNRIPHGGWCPKGRRAEDGVIPIRYVLQETESGGYMQRTKWNIRDSDATLIISLKAELIGGSKFTCEYARKIYKPCLHVYPSNKWFEEVKVFFETNLIQILNVAGPRGSKVPNNEQFVNTVLDEALKLSQEES